MANGVIPPPGGASPLPQVTDAQGWGKRRGRDPEEEKGVHWLTLGAPHPGMELCWGIWRKRGFFAIFQICCSSPPKPWEPGVLTPAWGQGRRG